MKIKLRLIYVIPFLFNFGIAASSRLVFSAKAPPKYLVLPTRISLLKKNFECKVFVNGSVKGTFQMENKKI